MRTMNRVLLITLSGLDRPGLVSEVAEVVAGLEANWEQSRMLHLADRFVGILEVHVRSDRAETLIEKLRGIKHLEITITTAAPSSPPQPTVEMEIMGMDHPGIVSEVFGVLGQAKVNVESLQTHVEPAANSGHALFRARARLTVPEGGLHALQASLEDIAQDVMVTVQPVGP